MLFMASTRDADRRFAEQYPCPAIWGRWPLRSGVRRGALIPVMAVRSRRVKYLFVTAA
jgi:hypothetical protein